MDKTIILSVYVSDLQDNQAIAGNMLMNRLRQAGIPVIGALGLISVERGELAMMLDHVDGRARCRFKWWYDGPPLSKDLTRHCYTLEKTLAMKIEENDL